MRRMGNAGNIFGMACAIRGWYLGMHQISGTFDQLCICMLSGVVFFIMLEELILNIWPSRTR
jgi:hypothetical protein